MRSTDTNLNNPLQIDNIDLQREIESWKHITIEIVDQDFYDLMGQHDPFVMYVIKDSKDNRMYLGDLLITNTESDSTYFISFSNTTKRYVLNVNIKNNFQTFLVPLSTYGNAQEAIDAMKLAMNAGSHDKLNLSIYTLLSAFIDDKVILHQLIVGLISLFGYRDDQRLQQVNQTAVSYGVFQYNSTDDKCIPKMFIEDLPKFSYQYDNSLFDMYNDLFNVMIKHELVKKNKYKNVSINDLDLSAPIKDIIDIRDKYLIPEPQVNY